MIERVSWRLFDILLSGLSIGSLWQTLLVHDSNKPHLITDPAEAERYTFSMFS